MSSATSLSAVCAIVKPRAECLRLVMTEDSIQFKSNQQMGLFSHVKNNPSANIL